MNFRKEVADVLMFNPNNLKNRVFELHILIFSICLCIHIPLMLFQIDLPLALVYGPILFFSFKDLTSNPVPRTVVYVHLLPFILMSFWFVILEEEQKDLYLNVFYCVSILSLIIYPTIIFIKQNIDDFVFNRSKLLILEVLSILGIAVSLFLLLMYLQRIKPFQVDFPLKAVVIFIIFSTLCLLGGFVYNIRKSESENKRPFASEDHFNKNLVLSEETINEYAKTLRTIMEDERLFLDSNLSLDKLAQQTSIPKSHISFYINYHLESNFYEWLATFRIAFALQLLHNGKDNLKLEFLANLSGFNSRTSFNRYFKQFVGLSPSDYRNKMIT